MDKPEAIDFGEQVIPTIEIASVHYRAWNRSYYVILSNKYNINYAVEERHTAYTAVRALYDYLHYVWVEEEDGKITFYANDPVALGILYETLERDNYAFVYSLGGTHNEITVYRNQGDDRDALDREDQLDSLIADFRTDKEEEE